jgi:hypothetical protein
MVSSGRERWWARAGGDNDPHSVLGVARGASSDEVQAAYRKQMKECHPDLAASQGHVDGGVSSETRARQINAAMEERPMAGAGPQQLHGNNACGLSPRQSVTKCSASANPAK